MSKKVKVKLKKKHYIGTEVKRVGTILEVDEDKVGRHMQQLTGKKAGAVERDDDEATKLTGDELDNAILEALSQLDPADDSHFTKGGEPAVDAVSNLVGQDVTRAEIKAAAPDFEKSE